MAASAISVREMASVEGASGEVPRAPTDLELHLRVIGVILEEHRLYHGARLQAVKDMVLRIFRDLAPEPLHVRRLQEVLCYEDVPLVSDNVLRQAVNELVRRDAKLKVVAKTPKQYVLTGPVPDSKDSIRDLVGDCWKRHFSTCNPAHFSSFQRCLALLFARYGCAAYDTLASRPGTTLRLDEVFAELKLPDADRSEFSDCFSEFIISPAPEDAALKVKLASAYALLRMNGAGNWGQDELRAFFSGRAFLLDTNVLFELMSRNMGQVTKMFRHLQDFGARFFVGAETMKELETALRAAAEQVIAVTTRGIDLRSLVDAQVVRSDWVRALCAEHQSPSRQQVHDRVERLLEQVDGMLDASAVARVHLERSPDDEKRRTRTARVQELALESRAYEKRDEVARHDALLWEAVEDEPALADMVLTMDRTLGRIRAGDRRIAIMLDEVVAYSLMGGAGESDLVELFGHALSQDLYPEAPFLQLNDILTIGGMEARLLTGPPRALRRAAAELSAIRAERMRSGEPVAPDEVGRVLLSAISAYEDDRRVAQREREAAESQRARAEDEAERRALAEREASEARERASRIEQEHALHKGSAERHAEALEGTLRSLTEERASLKADLAEQGRRSQLHLAEVEEGKQSKKKQRDWMLFAAVFMIAAVILFVTGVTWAGILAAAVAAIASLWPALAQETPAVSLPVLGFIATMIVGGAGLAEKWPQVRSALQLASPGALPSSSSSPAPAASR